jgi:hypothetical protein
MEIAVNASEESVINILQYIAKAPNKMKYGVFKTLTDKRNILDNKKDEPNIIMNMFETKDFDKELTNAVDKAKKYASYLEGIKNENAKDFFLNFYSG